MTRVCLGILLALCNGVQSEGISEKLDFSDGSSDTDVGGVSGVSGDVEVQHTIVLSTKLTNGRGLHAATTGADDVKLIRSQSRKQKDQRFKNDDSGEVPVVPGYRAVESTLIRTPDTRTSLKPYAESVFVNYNINPDGIHVYPENAADPRHWKPSTFFNNINWKSPDPDYLVTYNIPNNLNRRLRPNKHGIHRTIAGDGMKEYYCCKCREMIRESKSTARPRVTPPWGYETTTKVRLDGKLAKLD